MAATKMVHKRTNKTRCRFFNGRQTTSTTPRLTIPPSKRLQVCLAAEDNPRGPDKNCTHSSEAVRITAAGSEMRRTCLEKLPVVTLLFCSSVRTKLGIPMATAPISVSWIGMNGYLRPRQVKSRHNSTEYNVFVRYRALTVRCWQ